MQCTLSCLISCAPAGIEINSHSTPWCNLISPGSEKCMEIPLFMKVCHRPPFEVEFHTSGLLRPGHV